MCVTDLSTKVSPAPIEETCPASRYAPIRPELEKLQSANVRSFELSKATLKPHRVLLGLLPLGSRVVQLKPAWLPCGAFSETTHEPAGRSEAFWASFSTAPDFSRMPPESSAATASGCEETKFGATPIALPTTAVTVSTAKGARTERFLSTSGNFIRILRPYPISLSLPTWYGPAGTSPILLARL